MERSGGQRAEEVKREVHALSRFSGELLESGRLHEAGASCVEESLDETLIICQSVAFA